MGGYGSTRWGWHTRKITANECQRLTMADLIERAPSVVRVKDGYAGRVSWSCRGQPAGDIGYLLVANGVRLIYTITTAEGVKTDYDYRVEFETQPRHFGGQQWYFRCPECDRRASKLYRAPGRPRFVCRHCNGHTYASCQESRKYDALARMIGVTPEDMRRLDRMMRQRLK